jgi:RNA polymerase sigma-70 factor (ECF subfamily)
LSNNGIYNEQQLLLRIAEGDEKAFAQIYERFVPRLTPFVRKMLKEEPMVREVVQLTFIRLWMSRDTLREVRNFEAWIFRLATNVCYTHFKQLLTQERLLKQAAAGTSISHDPLMETMQAKALLSAVAEAVRQLSPQRKKIYTMSREQGLSVQEISTLTGLSPNTVRNTLSSSLDLIRQHLTQQGWNFSLIIIVLQLL